MAHNYSPKLNFTKTYFGFWLFSDDDIKRRKTLKGSTPTGGSFLQNMALKKLGNREYFFNRPFILTCIYKMIYDVTENSHDHF